MISGSKDNRMSEFSESRCKSQDLLRDSPQNVAGLARFAGRLVCVSPGNPDPAPCQAVWNCRAGCRGGEAPLALVAPSGGFGAKLPGTLLGRGERAAPWLFSEN